MLLMFPGQGSQKIGMGKKLYDNFESARRVFQEIDDAISFKLSDLIFFGDNESLKITSNAQPALMAVSIAALTVQKQEFGNDLVADSKYLAGHSLGEYTALCANGVLSLCDTAKILRARGIAMGQACTCGAMAAILGLQSKDLEDITRECSDSDALVQIANDNSVGQIVISGNLAAVKLAMDTSLKFGAKRAVQLDVSGPFHSALMEPAVIHLTQALDDVVFHDAKKPIIANFTAKEETKNFKDLLIKQITGQVRWRESILYAQSQGVRKFTEIGAGKVLTGLVKRIVPDAILENYEV